MTGDGVNDALRLKAADMVLPWARKEPTPFS
jgi:soluble P-type ATPase